MQPFRRPVSLATCLLAIVFVSGSALHAQERIELIGNVGDSTVIQELDVSFTTFDQMRRVSSVPETTVPAWVALAGGRYLVGQLYERASTSAAPLVAFDRRTRSYIRTFRTGVFRALQFIADPVKPRLFVSDTQGLYTLDAPSLTLTKIGAVGQTRGLAYAAKAERLFALRYDDVVVVVDVNSRVAIQEFPTVSDGGTFKVDPEARRLYVTAQTQTEPRAPYIALYDAATGTQMAASSVRARTFTLDEIRGHVIADVGQGEVAILNAETLALQQVVQLDAPSTPTGRFPSLNLLAGRLMSGAHVFRSLYSPEECLVFSVETFNADGSSRGVIDALAPMRASRNCWWSQAVLIEAPAAPPTPRASIVGSSVSLAWENPGNVSEFELQVGFAPNSPVLSHRVGLDTSINVSNVPPGIYYLRVRAINEIGSSPPSPEVQLVVP